MNPLLTRYLTQCYQRDILHESVAVEMPEKKLEVIAAAKAELERIDGLKLGVNLINRDFASYQNKAALERLLKHLES